MRWNALQILSIVLGGLLMMNEALSFTVDTATVGPPIAYRDTAWSSSTGGYDAVNPRGKRRSPPANVVREDALLSQGRRTRLQTGAQDLARNFSIAGWMIRRHLDYVALFDFHARNETYGRFKASKKELHDLDKQIEQLMREDSRPRATDVAGRFSREKMFRLAETRRTTDGDVGLLMLADGRMQGIEADCIRNPTEADLRGSTFRGNGDRTEWVDGFRVAPGGRCLAAAVHRRGQGGHAYELQRIVPMRNMIHFGHFSRFASDQTRGVSPVVSSINPLRDVYEGIDYTLARMKVDQLFAMAVYRDAQESFGEIGEDEPEDEEAGTAARYSVDFGRGPVFLDLDPGDRAEFLSSNNPSANVQTFNQAVIAIALKSLDIPYSFYDEAHTNFFGSRAAWMHYERSCIDKREDQISMRDEYTEFKLFTWIRQGRLVLPAGMTVADVEWEWVPRGMPWWDPSKEIEGDRKAVASGFDNPENICKRTGHGDVRDNIRATCRVMADARKISEEILGDPHAFRLDFGLSSSSSADDAPILDAVQKLAGVGKVLTVAEARKLLNEQYGLELDIDLDPSATGDDSVDDTDPDVTPDGEVMA